MYDISVPGISVPGTFHFYMVSEIFGTKKVPERVTKTSSLARKMRKLTPKSETMNLWQVRVMRILRIFKLVRHFAGQFSDSPECISVSVFLVMLVDFYKY